MLNILAEYPLQTMSKVQWVHYLTEAMRLSFWQREQALADPDFVKVPLARLLSADNAKQLRSLILKIRRHPVSGFREKLNHRTKKAQRRFLFWIEKAIGWLQHLQLILFSAPVWLQEVRGYC